MRLSKSLYSSGILNNGKVAHCREWDIGDYRGKESFPARMVERAQMRWEPGFEYPTETKPAGWKFLKNVLRIG
ncbi:MAG: hypothetical protein CMI18_10110 [Opitutaceae bacterium]|nr:hypothetical protein [Opitutaceae bacterium]|tara:strand:+ start:10904 stop:11122 length:219 start_codon:yes stop_codon:yes gene_type:complete